MTLTTMATAWAISCLVSLGLAITRNANFDTHTQQALTLANGGAA